MLNLITINKIISKNLCKSLLNSKLFFPPNFFVHSNRSEQIISFIFSTINSINRTAPKNGAELLLKKRTIT